MKRLSDTSDENGNNIDVKRAKLERDSSMLCAICQQNLDEIKLYSGHPNKSSEEFVALTNEKLSLFTGEETTIPLEDVLPCHKITHFSVYDKNGHLCAFDNGAIEKNILLFASGYIKPIYDEDPSFDNGIATHDMGPINEWYITGFDGGEKAVVGIVTSYAQYILMEPSQEYAAFLISLKQRIALVKLVIEFLIKYACDEPTYEDLLTHMENNGDCFLNEDFLLQNAQFICDQIYSYDTGGEDDHLQFIVTPCVRTLVQLAGVTFHNRKKSRQNHTLPKPISFTKATTTPLVKSIFESFFPDQIESDPTKSRKKRCGVCEACLASDCGKCAYCIDMPKFGGNGKIKQACRLRKCPNMAAEDSDSSDEEVIVINNLQASPRQTVNKVKWCSEPIFVIKGKEFYATTTIGDFQIQIGDYVMLNSQNTDCFNIGKVEFMFERFPQGPTLHALIFLRGCDTILGETADSHELFYANCCEECPLGSVVKKAKVVYKNMSKNWPVLNENETFQFSPKDGATFFYSKQYDPATATFSDYNEIERKDTANFCTNCYVESVGKKFETAIFQDESVQWRGECYRIGNGVFLNPSVYDFSCYQYESSNDSLKTVDETIYPEYWRKTADIKGSNLETSDPFCIGLIDNILTNGNDIKVKVRVFFRPENTKNSVFLAHESDINVVYWTDEFVSVAFQDVVLKCHLKYFDSNELATQWCEEGPYRFYFTEAYNPKNYQFREVPEEAKRVGYSGKGKGKGKGKSAYSSKNLAPEWPKIDRPLKCMDVFAGCGGLSKGLHQSGIAETKWAIEKEPAAAQAFQLNNQDCLVFTHDCNKLLQDVISGEGTNKGLPARGEVEMLVGGPPCQGFSGMNRFNAGQYSLFKNSLVVSFLSYCDYYRPKYFVLENVSNFVSFKRSIILKLTLRCLLAIGYQITFGVLQAGHYGVPQTRRRLILIAAAPGYVLPKLPEPLHVFSKRGCNLSFALDGKKYSNGFSWIESAPYRTICVRDAISDLPEIKNGWNQTEMAYDDDAISHFQRNMRNSETEILLDHICKEMAPIVEARIAHIPEIPGSDWRDLPNISVRLSDGNMTSILQYPYRNKKHKNRGVCRCSTGQTCDPNDRQINTLIPWCLPHTADRHNHWAGLYGRIEWDGYFATTITNPEPIGKQGRVLHPEQNRVVSVRECARSQGFPDNFKFYGNIMDKHRQVGNAVPPPLGKAIGMEIKKALIKCHTVL